MAAGLARRAALAMRRELMMDGVVGRMQWLAGGGGDPGRHLRSSTAWRSKMADIIRTSARPAFVRTEVQNVIQNSLTSLLPMLSIASSILLHETLSNYLEMVTEMP